MSGFSGKEIHVDDQYLHVSLSDGRLISTPIDWYPELMEANLAQLKHYHFICDQTGIEWSDIDYHLSIENMMQVNRSQS
ncbi:MAG: DUF2442 domain-containing protein [Hydrogenovibrio sp.]|uniref:DUF2442 domain-containing protein n=1 Tax=Hydrogenovibrio sp. TaxID=2065821 RepID=UPI0028702AB6|nr:DUF2442 domain-containing protein [Hydrogenovibrio sp.]MDR9498493.1 DUF2442 domain-containing protein [Hydrogenovibrio sp.]